MYIIFALVIIIAAAYLARSLLYWTFPEVPDDVLTLEEPAANAAHFYDPRSWAIFQTVPLIGYRRDKRGRFRKMP